MNMESQLITKLPRILLLAVAWGGLVASAAANPDHEQVNTKFAEFAEQSRQEFAEMTFEEFEAAVFKEPIEDGQYIVNGDTTIPTKKALREFYDRQVRIKPAPPAEANPEFIIARIGGVDGVWPVAKKHALTYCVSKKFGDDYKKVVDAMEMASSEWEKYADLSFLYLSHEDARCTARNKNVVFDVRPVNFAAYYARAFRPYYPRRKRNVLIDQMSLNLPQDGKLQLVGVLRHELGHTIGARHEHTRPDSGTCFEDNNFRAITDYDAFSVMHYPQCNGKADRSFQLTDRDKAGVSCVYGPAPGAESHVDLAMCTTGQRVFAERNKLIQVGQKHRFEPLPVRPGTEIRVAIENSQGESGPDTGDADLYLNFDQPPHRLQFACRPHQEDANEVCTTIVPDAVSNAQIMVEGHDEVTYNLTVTYIEPMET